MKSGLYNEHTLVVIKQRPSSQELHTVQTPPTITPTRYPAHTNLPHTHPTNTKTPTSPQHICKHSWGLVLTQCYASPCRFWAGEVAQPVKVPATKPDGLMCATRAHNQSSDQSTHWYSTDDFKFRQGPECQGLGGIYLPQIKQVAVTVWYSVVVPPHVYITLIFPTAPQSPKIPIFSNASLHPSLGQITLGQRPHCMSLGNMTEYTRNNPLSPD